MLHSAFSRWRDYLTPASHTSTFTTTGELTPEEFVAAGDYLCYKFPTWSWAAADPSKRVSYLPDDKQYLVLKHAPCHTRLDDNFSTWNPGDEEDWDGGEAGDVGPKHRGKVKTVDESGDVEEETGGDDDDDDDESDDEIPDMDDEEDDDEAIIRDSSRKKLGKGIKAPLRYYNLYLTYSTYFKVPRSFISGFDGATNIPLHPPTVMFEDIAPDYREKTVTIEPFPCLDAPLQMASVHPCKHAETMKRIFDGMVRRKARREAELSSTTPAATTTTTTTTPPDDTTTPPPAAAQPEQSEDWEQIAAEDEDGLLRVDQYLVVFVKFMAGVMPGVEMDYTMAI